MKDFERRLTGEQKRAYAALVERFLRRVAIDGVEGIVPTEDERLAIAGSCSLLFAARPEWPFPPVRRVVLAPWPLVREGTTCRSFPEGKYAGVHLPGAAYGESEIWIHRHALEVSLRNPADGYNVGMHEFAHALDASGGASDGVPMGLPQALLELWLRTIEQARAAAGQRGSPFDAYASKHPRETFAVSVEEFFERPEALEKKMPDFYVQLTALFRQDPAAVDRRERRLRLTEAAMGFAPGHADGRRPTLEDRANLLRRLQRHVPEASLEECEAAIKDVLRLRARGRW